MPLVFLQDFWILGVWEFRNFEMLICEILLRLKKENKETHKNQLLLSNKITTIYENKRILGPLWFERSGSYVRSSHGDPFREGICFRQNHIFFVF